MLQHIGGQETGSPHIGGKHTQVAERAAAYGILCEGATLWFQASGCA